MTTPRRVKYRVSRSYSQRMYRDDNNGVYRKLSDDYRPEDEIRQEKFEARSRPLSYAFGSHSFRETGNRDWDTKGQSLILLKKARSRNSLNLPRNFNLDDFDVNANPSHSANDKSTIKATGLFDEVNTVLSPLDNVPDRDIVQLDDIHPSAVSNTHCQPSAPVTDILPKPTSTRSNSTSSDSSSSSGDTKVRKSTTTGNDNRLPTAKARPNSWQSSTNNSAQRSLGSTGSYDSQSSCPRSMLDQSLDSFEIREPRLIYSTIDCTTQQGLGASSRSKEQKGDTDNFDDLFDYHPTSEQRLHVSLKNVVPALAPRQQSDSLERKEIHDLNNGSIASEQKFQDLLDDFENKGDCLFDSALHFLSRQIEEEDIDSSVDVPDPGRKVDLKLSVDTVPGLYKGLSFETGENRGLSLIKENNRDHIQEPDVNKNILEPVVTRDLALEPEVLGDISTELEVNRDLSLEQRYTHLPNISCESVPPPLPESAPPLDIIDIRSDLDFARVTTTVLNDSTSSNTDSDTSSDRSVTETKSEGEIKMATGDYVSDEFVGKIPSTEVAYYGPIYAKDNTLILPTDLPPPRRRSLGSTGSLDNKHDTSTESTECVCENGLQDSKERLNYSEQSYRSSLSSSSYEYHLHLGSVSKSKGDNSQDNDVKNKDVEQDTSVSSTSSNFNDDGKNQPDDVIIEWKFTTQNDNEDGACAGNRKSHRSSISSKSSSSGAEDALPVVNLPQDASKSTSESSVLNPTSKVHNDVMMTSVPDNRSFLYPSDHKSSDRADVEAQHAGIDTSDIGHQVSYKKSSKSSSESSSSSSDHESDEKKINAARTSNLETIELKNDGAPLPPVDVHVKIASPKDWNDAIDKNADGSLLQKETDNNHGKQESGTSFTKTFHYNVEEPVNFKTSAPIASSSPKHSRKKPSKVPDNSDVINTSRELDGAIAHSGGDTKDEGENERQHQGHFVVVAIDFGTTYSGYAFSFTSEPDSIHIMRKWEGGDPGVINQKTPTTVLLTPEGLFHSFGFSARDNYHDLDKEEAKQWLYFDKFKMILHNTAELSTDTLLKASNGKLFPAIRVFSYALQFFKDHALQELSDQSGTKIINDDIRWVISVPAIWKASAKQFMRQAAYEAGLISPECPDQLIIALEPEAASIYCRKLRIHQLIPDVMVERPLQPPNRGSPEPMNMSPACEEVITGTRYMVVDCGGGTVDITVHEVSTGGKLKELYRASGGPFGSIGVDREFEKLMCTIFGKDFIEQFQQKRPVGWMDLMIAFESRKRSASPDKAASLNVSLPFSFIDYFKKHKSGHIEGVIKKHADKGIQWSSQGMLRISPDAMRVLFVPTMDRIKQAIGDVLNDPNTRGLKYLFLVGGFAESRVLQHEMRKEFSPLLKVIIPQGMGLSILKGSVLFGLDPTVVKVRKSRLTYGVGVLNKYNSERHPREKQVQKDGREWCTDVFDKYVEIDQPVAVGDVVLRSYTPVMSDQRVSQINIYSSENPSATFVTDPGVHKCGTLELELSQENMAASTKREIQTRMQFGETEIKVSALDVTSGVLVQAKIDFLNR